MDTRTRLIQLMGAGVSAEQAALATGITPSAVSQYMDSPEFAAEVTELRYATLSRHNERDNSYDALEDKLLQQLETYLPMLTDPLRISRILQIVNGAKRRGASTPENALNKQVHVTLVLPTKIVNSYKVNSDNQVIQVGDRDLVTIQSDTLLKKAKQHAQLPELPEPIGLSEAL